MEGWKEDDTLEKGKSAQKIQDNLSKVSYSTLSIFETKTSMQPCDLIFQQIIKDNDLYVSKLS